MPDVSLPNSSKYYPNVDGQTMQQFMSQVYLWMMAGLGISAAIALYLQNNTELFQRLISNSLLFNGLIVLQLGVVIAFSFLQRRISAATATLMYLAYSLLTGVTLSVVLYVFTKQTITLALASTAGAFLGLSIFGFVTKRDLGPIGTFCIMGLFGLIIVSVLTMFVHSMQTAAMNLTLGVLGVLIFSGLTAYDTQKIKQSYALSQGQDRKKLVISGALMLYLDFINLFLSMLRLFGGGRR